MRLNQFSVRIIGGRETSGGYVEMQHSQKYSLSLRNDRDRRCDARVEIDGKHVGTWRVDAHRNIVLERPADDDGCFTFYRAGSKKGAKAGIVEGDPNNGLVVVRFTPEIYRYTLPARPICPRPWYPRPWYPWLPYEPYRPYKPWVTYTWTTGTSGGYTVDCDASEGTLSFGGTNFVSCSTPVQDVADYRAGGTGLSSQSDQTYGVASSIYHDDSQQTTINLRLVWSKGRQEEPRPLVAQGNPVPPPV